MEGPGDEGSNPSTSTNRCVARHVRRTARTARRRQTWRQEGCIANRYAQCMAQLVTRLDDRLVEQIDALVAAGVVANRSEAVRVGLTTLIEHHRRRMVGEEIVEGYRRQPQTDEELAGVDDATRSQIEEEAW